MHTPSYLLKNSFGIYHLRLAVPKHLRYVVGKREIKKTLRTGNRREALRKARRLATILQDRFDEMTLIDGVWFSDIKMSRFKKHADGSVEIEGLEMDPNHPEAEQAALDKILGNNQQPATTNPDSITLQNLINEYLEAMAEDCNTKTLAGYTAHLTTFLEIIGDIPISEITRKQARGAVSTLKKLPPNRNTAKQFRDLSIAAIIQLKPSTVISPVTLKLYIERISALFQFAMAERYTDFNPFTKLIPKKKQSVRADNQRHIFSDKDIAALFAPEHNKTDPQRMSRTWINLLAAYSGMRLEELCQIQISDIKGWGNIPYFDINNNNGNQIKNNAAARDVPIHSEILKRGFESFVNGQKGSRLFPDLSKSNGKYGHNYSKWFKRHREKSNVIDPGKTFHSFRHNVATQFKHAGILETKAAAVLGHTISSQTYGRYGKPYPLDQLQEVIETINYGDLIP